MKYAKLFAAILAVAVLAGLMTGCGSKPKVGIFIPIACDYSKSSAQSEKARTEYARVIIKLVNRYKGTAYIRVYKYAHAQYPEVVYEGQPRKPREVLATAKLDLIVPGATKGENTYLASTVKQMVTDASLHPDLPVAAVILTDGGCDDPVETKAAVAELAKMNLEVLWAGPAKSEAGLRTRFERIMSPIASKLVVSGPNDLDYGYTTFIEKGVIRNEQ